MSSAPSQVGQTLHQTEGTSGGQVKHTKARGSWREKNDVPKQDQWYGSCSGRTIKGPSGRRRLTKAERARIAAESMMPGVTVADVARKHGTTRWQVYDWRNSHHLTPQSSKRSCHQLGAAERLVHTFHRSWPLEEGAIYPSRCMLVCQVSLDHDSLPIETRCLAASPGFEKRSKRFGVFCLRESKLGSLGTSTFRKEKILFFCSES